MVLTPRENGVSAITWFGERSLFTDTDSDCRGHCRTSVVGRHDVAALRESPYLSGPRRAVLLAA